MFKKLENEMNDNYLLIFYDLKLFVITYIVGEDKVMQHANKAL